VTLGLALHVVAWGAVALAAVGLVYVAVVAGGALVVGIAWVLEAFRRRHDGP